MPMTLGLQNLRGQVDEAFPNRDKSSDGGIGDAAHRARKSGHNPDDTTGSKPTWDGDNDMSPEWRAWDCDADLREDGVTAQRLVDHVRKLPKVGTVLRFIIFNRKIYHVDDNFQPEDYFGDNPHDKHIHFEGAYTNAADNNTMFDFKLGDLFMLSEADKKWLSDKIDAAATAAAKRVWDTRFDIETGPDKVYNATAGSIITHIPGEHTRVENAVKALTPPTGK